MPRMFRSVVPAALIVLAPGLAAPLPAQPRTRLVFVQATDAAGAPIVTLTPADFTLREGGETREIVTVRLANEPMRIALIVDTSEPAAPALIQLREALQTFITTLPPEHEIVFITTGRQFRVHVQPTTDRERVAKAISTIFTDRGAGNVLLDSLVEADDRFLRRDDVSWPVIVMITTDGPEGSTVTRTEEYNAFVQSITARAGTVHATLLQSRTGVGLPLQVAMNLTQATGGQYESLNVNAAAILPETLRKLADAIAEHHRKMSSYYRVEYRSTSTTPQPVEVGVVTNGRSGMDVLFGRRMR